MQSTGQFAILFLWLPFSFYDPVNHVNSLARQHKQLNELNKLNKLPFKYPGLFLKNI